MNITWVSISDFSDICEPHEKLGWNPPKRRRIEAYKNCMRICEKVDSGFLGQRFTWYNKRATNPIMERLDRAWATTDWCDSLPIANLKHLPRVSSDHCPIPLLFSNSPLTRKPKIFRFEPMRCLDPKFRNMISDIWKYVQSPFRVNFLHWLTIVFCGTGTLLATFSKKSRILDRINSLQKWICEKPFDSRL